MEETSLSQIVNVKAQLMTEDSFRPYGALLAPRPGPADFRGLNSDGWKTPFEIHGVPELMVLKSRFSGMRFTRLERHFQVAQTFIPLGHVAALVAVAEPSTDPGAIPEPEDVKAFVVDGSCGYVLKPGTWHSLDRYPLYDAESIIVIITSHETQVELESAAQVAWRLTEDVDYATRFGITFELSA